MKNGRENVNTVDPVIVVKNRKGWRLAVYEQGRGMVKVIARCIKNPDLVIHAEMTAESVRGFDPATYWAEGMKIRRAR